MKPARPSSLLWGIVSVGFCAALFGFGLLLFFKGHVIVAPFLLLVAIVILRVWRNSN
jgi:hypothetical protein